MLSGLEKSALVIMVKQAAEVERIKKKKKNIAIKGLQPKRQRHKEALTSKNTEIKQTKTAIRPKLRKLGKTHILTSR